MKRHVTKLTRCAFVFFIGSFFIFNAKRPGEARLAHAVGSGRREKTLCAEGILELGWGAGPREVARHHGNEGASEGPMSFHVDGQGGVYVLDQVNQRVVEHRPGGAVKEYYLPSDTYQDLAVAPGGEVLVLDRLRRSSLLLLAPDGSYLDEVGVLGPGIPEGGGITGLLLREDGVWIEYGHTHSVRVLDHRLLPCTREIWPGRPLDDSGSMGAKLNGLGGAELWIQEHPTGMEMAWRELFMSRDIRRIVWLDATPRGEVVAVFHLLEREPLSPWRVIHEETAGVVLDPALNLVAELRTPYVINEFEQFREFFVSASGSVYQMAFSQNGVKFLCWGTPGR